MCLSKKNVPVFSPIADLRSGSSSQSRCELSSAPVCLLSRGSMQFMRCCLCLVFRFHSVGRGNFLLACPVRCVQGQRRILRRGNASVHFKVILLGRLWRAYLQFLTSPATHMRKKKANTLKFVTELKKKKVAQTFCRSVTCLITMAAPLPPARHPSSLLATADKAGGF